MSGGRGGCERVAGGECEKKKVLTGRPSCAVAVIGDGDNEEGGRKGGAWRRFRLEAEERRGDLMMEIVSVCGGETIF